MFDFVQTKSFLNSRGSGSGSRSRLQDRDLPPSGSGGGTSSERDRENFSRWRDRQYFGPRRWLETALRDNPYEKDTGRNHIGIILQSVKFLVLFYSRFLFYLRFCSEIRQSEAVFILVANSELY